MKSLLILGRQPALGLAELESLFGPDKIKPIGPDAVLVDVDADSIPFARLGGSIKLTKVLTELSSTDWNKIEEFLSKTIPEHLQYVPEGKFRLGLSAYGLRVRPHDINATGLRLKKIIRAADRSVRIVPNKSPALNSAQILHNQLATPTGWELVMIRNGNKSILAQTYAEQDIEAYARRDQGRPKRDAKVGMLPPKLAQIILNLAIGQRDPKSEEVNVLDPFCGTGVLLQEALLAGCSAIGSDLDPRMVDYSQQNLHWLYQKSGYPGPGMLVSLDVADATKATWNASFDTIACETFLGKPLSKLPEKHSLQRIMKECDDLHTKFLGNLAKHPSVRNEAENGRAFRFCIAVPAWRTKSGFLHLKTLDHLHDLGYNRIRFTHARNEDLIYHRPDQIVARELVILEKK